MAKFASLWVGPMTRLERLSINSFVKNNHEHHIYLYDMENAKKLPKEAIIHDANEIIPESEVFKDITLQEYFQFADFFRLHLLNKNDYIWTDLDTICLSKDWQWNEMFLAPFETREGEYNGRLAINNSMFYMKPGSPFLTEMVNSLEGWDFTKSRDPFILSPHFFTKVFVENKKNYDRVKQYIYPYYITYPIHYIDIWKIYLEQYKDECDFKARKSFAIHLWRNTLKNSQNGDKTLLDTQPDKDSYLYDLYQKYLPFSSQQDWQNL